MPYYHGECDGMVKWFPPFPVSPKCQKCGKVWSVWTVYGPSPIDMYYVPLTLRGPKKGTTDYAKWADKAPPGVALVASRLPRWPRWLRLTVFIGFIGLVVVGFSILRTIGWWAVLLGVLGLIVGLPLIIFRIR